MCISTCFVSLFLHFLYLLYLLYRWVCHMCVSLYLQHPLINAAVQPPRLIFVPVLHLLLPPFYSFRDDVLHIEPCLLLLHTCLSLCFSLSVFVFAINIDQCFSLFVCFPRKEIWAQICVFQYLSAADILPQFFRRYILGGGKTTCQKKSQRSFHIQIWIRKNQIELRDSNVAKKLLKFSLFLRKLERQATLSCVIWSLQHESRLQNICPNLGIYKWE